MKKHHRKARHEILKRACAIRNLHSCNNFAIVLHENALVFS